MNRRKRLMAILLAAMLCFSMTTATWADVEEVSSSTSESEVSSSSIDEDTSSSDQLSESSTVESSISSSDNSTSSMESSSTDNTSTSSDEESSSSNSSQDESSSQDLSADKVTSSSAEDDNTLAAVEHIHTADCVDQVNVFYLNNEKYVSIDLNEVADPVKSDYFQAFVEKNYSVPECQSAYNAFIIKSAKVKDGNEYASVLSLSTPEKNNSNIFALRFLVVDREAAANLLGPANVPVVLTIGEEGRTDDIEKEIDVELHIVKGDPIYVDGTDAKFEIDFLNHPADTPYYSDVIKIKQPAGAGTVTGVTLCTYDGTPLSPDEGVTAVYTAGESGFKIKVDKASDGKYHFLSYLYYKVNLTGPSYRAVYAPISLDIKYYAKDADKLVSAKYTAQLDAADTTKNKTPVTPELKTSVTGLFDTSNADIDSLEFTEQRPGRSFTRTYGNDDIQANAEGTAVFTVTFVLRPGTELESQRNILFDNNQLIYFVIPDNTISAINRLETPDRLNGNAYTYEEIDLNDLSTYKVILEAYCSQRVNGITTYPKITGITFDETATNFDNCNDFFTLENFRPDPEDEDNYLIDAVLANEDKEVPDNMSFRLYLNLTVEGRTDKIPVSTWIGAHAAEPVAYFTDEGKTGINNAVTAVTSFPREVGRKLDLHIEKFSPAGNSNEIDIYVSANDDSDVYHLIRGHVGYVKKDHTLLETITVLYDPATNNPTSGLLSARYGFAPLITNQAVNLKIPAATKEYSTISVDLTPEKGCVITFMSDGKVYQTKEIMKDTDAGPLPTPTKSGYKFLGWYTVGNEKFTEYTWVDSDVTVYARWEKLKGFDITFNPNGGEGSPTVVHVTENEKIDPAVIPTPIRKPDRHWRFDGWYTDKTYLVAFDKDQPITKSMTVYAKWTQLKCTVNFDVNGMAGVTTPASIVVDINSTLGSKIPALTPPHGQRFVGWYLDGQEFKSTTPVTADITLKAKWAKEDQFVVTFNSQGGTVKPTTSLVFKNDTLPQPLPTPIREHYIFGGWYLEATCEHQFVPATPIVADITLYAKWTPIKYTVTFDTNDGTAILFREVDYNTTVTPWPSNPPRTDYTFKGWYEDNNAFTKPFTSTTLVTGNITVYAMWEYNGADKVTVKFDTKGGTPSKYPDRVEKKGTTISLPTPTKSSYNFVGWYSDDQYKMPFTSTTKLEGNIIIENAVTLYAKWEYLPPTVDENDWNVSGNTSSNSSGSGGSGGSSGGSKLKTATGIIKGSPTTSCPNALASKPLDVSEALKIIKNALKSSKTAQVAFRNESSVSASTLASLAQAAKQENGSVQLLFDRVLDCKIVARLYINAAQVKNDLKLNVTINQPSIMAIFQKYFKNKVQAVTFDQSPSFGAQVGVAVKLDLTGMNPSQFKFYAYDIKTNAYHVIIPSNVFMDKNGYLHFTTDTAGTILVTDSVLTRQ